MTARRNLLLVVGTGAVAGAGGLLAGRWLFSPAAEAPKAAAAEPAGPPPNEVELSPEAMRNFGLETAVVGRRPLSRTIRVTGMVGFNELRLAHINPLVRGRVQVIEVAVGDRVKAGQRLAVLDALELADARHRLATAEAGLLQANAEATTARAAMQRAQELVRGGALAQSEMDRRRAELARAEAAVQTRTVEVDQWREMLQRYSPASIDLPGPDAVGLAGASPQDARGAMLAPFDGTVLSIGATPGELVDTGREVFGLADLSTMWVQADIPERELGAVREGAAAGIAVEAWPGRRFTGNVARIADQLDARTGTAKVRCDVRNADGALKANMFAIVEIAAPLGREGLVVPDSALQTIQGQAVVFVHLDGRRFARRDVRIGRRDGATAEVVDGLAGVETVVTQGSFQLKSLLLRGRAGQEG